jgi:hypothetical protein
MSFITPLTITLDRNAPTMTLDITVAVDTLVAFTTYFVALLILPPLRWLNEQLRNFSLLQTVKLCNPINVI